MCDDSGNESKMRMNQRSKSNSRFIDGRVLRAEEIIPYCNKCKLFQNRTLITIEIFETEWIIDGSLDEGKKSAPALL